MEASSCEGSSAWQATECFRGLSVKVDSTADDCTVLLTGDERHNVGDTELSAASAADTVLGPRPRSPKPTAAAGIEAERPRFESRGGRSTSERRALWQLMAAEQPAPRDPKIDRSGFPPSTSPEARSCNANSSPAHDDSTALGLPPLTTPRETWAFIGPLLGREQPDRGALS